MAAREAARQGAQVLLVDKATFPRYKVCGSCLNLRALATLDAVGLTGLIQRTKAVPLARFQVATNRRQAVVPLPGGAALSREALDAALVEEAIAAGAAFLPATLASLRDADSRSRYVTLRQDKRERLASARLVLAADGLGGRFLSQDRSGGYEIDPESRVGAAVIADNFPTFYDEGAIYMA
jgi:flavin-dependent dehydrogenase